jgi:predicted nucleic-acid-binding Zn-ribbon protein
MRKNPCPKCGSAEIVREVRVIDRGHGNADSGNINVGVYTKPEAWLFKGKVATDLTAYVCAQCGFTELYATDPRALADAAAQAVSQRG